MPSCFPPNSCAEGIAIGSSCDMHALFSFGLADTAYPRPGSSPLPFAWLCRISCCCSILTHDFVDHLVKPVDDDADVHVRGSVTVFVMNVGQQRDALRTRDCLNVVCRARLCGSLVLAFCLMLMQFTMCVRDSASQVMNKTRS